MPFAKHLQRLEIVLRSAKRRNIVVPFVVNDAWNGVWCCITDTSALYDRDTDMPCFQYLGGSHSLTVKGMQGDHLVHTSVFDRTSDYHALIRYPDDAFVLRRTPSGLLIIYRGLICYLSLAVVTLLLVGPSIDLWLAPRVSLAGIFRFFAGMLMCFVYRELAIDLRNDYVRVCLVATNPAAVQLRGPSKMDNLKCIIQQFCNRLYNPTSAPLYLEGGEGVWLGYNVGLAGCIFSLTLVENILGYSISRTFVMMIFHICGRFVFRI